MKIKHFIVLIIIILVDQISKLLLINKNIIIIPNLLEFTYTENIGGAFGIGKQIVVTALSLFIIIGIIIYLIKEKNKISNKIIYIVILAGSVSNLGDRIFRGYVIHFINISFLNFPIFNIADICIVLGIFSLMIYILLKK